MEEEIQPVLVIALLENEGIQGIHERPRQGHRQRTGSQDNNLDGAPGHVDPKEALDQLLTLLIKVYEKQLEEAEEIAALNLAKYRQVDLHQLFRTRVYLN